METDLFRCFGKEIPPTVKTLELDITIVPKNVGFTTKGFDNSLHRQWQTLLAIDVAVFFLEGGQKDPLEC